MKADARSATRLNSILDDYSVGSGQHANKQKSSIFFSPNCGASMKRGVRSITQIFREALSEKYLGLPTANGRVTEDQLVHIFERARSKVQGWCERFLSCAAKEVLLKSVIQALPTYTMSCFKLTKGLCKKITAVMSKYWWAGSLDKKGMHWQSWEKMAISKNHGGLGFRDLETFNDAMLAKQSWRLMEKPESLCARVLKGRYYPSGDVLSAECPSGASQIWRSICKGREVLKKGLIRRIGDGMRTEIWHDNWIAGSPSMKPMGRRDAEPV